MTYAKHRWWPGAATLLLWWRMIWCESPRPDVLRGLNSWKWLISERLRGNYIDRTVQVRCEGPLSGRLAIAEAVAIDRGAILWMGRTGSCEGRIQIGSRCYLGPHVYLGSLHDLRIGSDTLIGAGAYVITANHNTRRPDQSIMEQGYTGADVHIGRRVWVGARAVILPGVTIGDNAVIAAAAVVRRDVPEGEVWGGVPARYLKPVFMETSPERRETRCD